MRSQKTLFILLSILVKEPFFPPPAGLTKELKKEASPKTDLSFFIREIPITEVMKEHPDLPDLPERALTDQPAVRCCSLRKKPSLQPYLYL